jgi:hypothetical protein
MNIKTRMPGSGDGCGFLIATCLITCCFLVINALLVAALYTTLSPVAPEMFRRARIAQVILFAGPVLLVFVEWWLFDLVMDWLAPSRSTQDGNRTTSRRSRV